MLAAKHLLGFSGVDLRGERVEGALEVPADIFPAARPFEQHAKVVELRGEAVAQLEIFREAALALERLLRFGLVVPECRCGDLAFELG